MNPASLAASSDTAGLLQLRSLPRRGLAAGGGHVREICGSADMTGQRGWTLQLVEVRGPVGMMPLAPDAAHVIAGIGGPQVDIGPGVSIGLRKDRILPLSGSHVEFRRPLLRAAELSRIAMLSFPRTGPSASLAFVEMHGATLLPDGARVLLVRSGSVTVAGITARAMEALVLPADPPPVVAAEARVLLVRE